KAIYGPAPARLAGARAGITTYGKNCFAYARDAAGKSSWIVNEPFLVDKELAPDEPTMKLGCPEDCRKCIDACPTGALYAPLKMDPRKCIARMSYFQDGPIPLEIRPRMGTWIYGCDRCQEACPRNKPWMEKSKPMDEALLVRAADLEPARILSMDQDHYEARVWPLLYYMRKESRRLWQRNAAVASGNEGSPDSVPVLGQAMENPEPLVRAHAAWALGRIGGAKAQGILEKKRAGEPDAEVLSEIVLALTQT
ncbi:MAG TPA: 4Fe-4S double cluster binding domain-containing protein, partial [Thermodesulfobacteriota bacterium]|nr:4Fe-4S double cluster binding domain-containing protein [Thermodesulfobacteriota bacterium]